MELNGFELFSEAPLNSKKYFTWKISVTGAIVLMMRRALVNNNRFKPRQPVDWRLKCPCRTLLDFLDASGESTQHHTVTTSSRVLLSLQLNVLCAGKTTIYVSVCRFSATHVSLLLFLSHFSAHHPLSGVSRSVSIVQWSNFVFMQQASTHIRVAFLQCILEIKRDGNNSVLLVGCMMKLWWFTVAIMLLGVFQRWQRHWQQPQSVMSCVSLSAETLSSLHNWRVKDMLVWFRLHVTFARRWNKLHM